MNFGSKTGIGKLVNIELHSNNFIRVYSLIFLIGVIGFLINKIVEFVDYKTIHWVKNKK